MLLSQVQFQVLVEKMHTTTRWQAPVENPLSPRESSASDHPVTHVLQAVQNVHLCKCYDLSISECLVYLERAFIACQYSQCYWTNIYMSIYFDSS